MRKSKKILHLSNNITGGIGTIIDTLIRVFNTSDYKSSYITYAKDAYKMFHMLFVFIAGNFCDKYFSFFKNKYDIFHFHGCWTLHLLLLKYAKGIKTVVSPHGAFNKVSLKKSKYKKMLASFLFVKPAYKNADCILALTNDELNDILNYGVKNVPIAVIPNGINLEEDILISSNYKEELVSLAKDRKVILSLSRLHSSKGIDLLLEAFNTFKNNKNYVLFIVGDGDDAYKKKLKDIIKKYQLENSIFMLGHKGGKEKNTLYEFADLFVLPSYNEGFGLTILEALRQETPVITTTGTPFKELPLRDCGWCVRPEIVAIKEAIEEYDALDYLEISKMKKNGLDWLKTDFDENIIAEKMDVLYTWLVNGGEIPNFVYNGDEIV